MKFDARVISVFRHLASAKQHLQKSDYQLEVAKFKAAEHKLLEKLPDEKQAIHKVFRNKMECIGHFRCDRFTFLQPLQDFACFVDGTTTEEVVDENAWTAALHIVLMGQNDAMIVPFEFPVPFCVDVDGRAHPYNVCSGPHIQGELDLIDEYVAVEETLGVRQFGAFIDFSRDQMAKFERQEGIGRRFWAKFGVAALRGLTERALKAGLPVLVDPQFSEVPVTA